MRGDRETALHAAAKKGDFGRVKDLADQGVDIDAKDNYGGTALINAAVCGNLDMVKYLVEQGADKEATDSHGWTALIHAAVGDWLYMVKYLVDKEATDKNALIYAVSAWNGKLDVVKYLIEQGANKEAIGSDGRTALIHAAWFGNLDMVKYLIKQGVSKEATDKNGWTALICAAERGNLDVVKYLVERGVNKEATDANGWTALVRAGECGKLDVVKYLVEQGARDKEGKTVLMQAAAEGALEKVKSLVGRGDDMEVKDKDGRTALMYAATHDKLYVVKYLVEQGANKEATDKNGVTALIYAASAWNGKLDVVKYLVEQGANKEATDKNGLTALIYAASAWNGKLDVVKYLFEQGARDKDGKTVLMQAAAEGVLKKVKHLIGRGDDLEVKDNDGRTALMYAAMHGKLDVVKYFVDRGADASCVDNDGNSLLHHLLTFTDRTWWNGWVTRPSLSEEDLLPIAKLLLDRGMPLDSNRADESARSIAKSRKFSKLVRLLKEYERKRLAEEILALKSRQRPEPEEEAPSWAISPHQIDIQSPLAEGGYGVVSLATWKNSVVVVKQIRAVEMRKFLKEVEIWYKLSHRNIVRFYGANHKTGPYFIVSDYASNGELVSYLKREKATVTWQKLYEVAVGLSYLHGEKLVHGDLKCNNIVVSKDGTAMLTDFGLTFSEDGSCSLAHKKDTLGAMAWRAPEFAIPDSTTRPTQKSDVYSLGMCIVEAVTCEKPWGAYSNDEIRGFLRQGEIKVEKPSEMTGEQWQLVQRMTAVCPDDRPDVDEVLLELKRFADAEREAEFKADQLRRCPF